MGALPQDTLYGFRMRSNSLSLAQAGGTGLFSGVDRPFPSPSHPGSAVPLHPILLRPPEGPGTYYDGVDAEALRHYLLVSGDEWYDILSTQPPPGICGTFRRQAAGCAMSVPDSLFFDI